MKKKILLISISIIILLIVVLGFIIYFNDNLRFKVSYELYNYIEYSNGKTIPIDIPIDNGIRYLDSKELFDFLDRGTGILYLGYSSCPWCRNIVEPLIDVSRNYYDGSINYVDVHSYDGDSEQLISKLNDFLEVDNEGKKHLYVPDVYFVKDGKILSHHISTVSDYKDPFEGMNDEQITELKSIYINGINLIKGDVNE